MRRVVVVALGLLAIAVPLRADDGLVKFEGGIGVVPVRLAAGVAVPNTVQGVNPGGQPWVIGRLRAWISDDGQISVDGRGLLLAGGNNIGNSGGVNVRAMLFCGTTSFTSDLVQLDEEGDFRIDGLLSAVPPNPCTNPTLLIVSAGGSWFAAGIPKR
jgi:hypothetical protein